MAITYDFDAAKAREVAAWFLARCGGRMDKLKLVKLLYLAEREALDRFLRPIMGGAYFSLPHGPVLSESLNAINEGWNGLLSFSGNQASLTSDEAFEPLLLSDNEISVLDDVFRKWGQHSASGLRNKTHDLPEYQDPAGSRLPIHVEDILRNLGKGTQDIGEACELAEKRNLITRLFPTA